MTGASYGSWGNLFSPRQEMLPMRDRTLPLPACEPRMLPYGMGRSYGDSCLNDGHALIRGRDLDHFIAFDPATGVLRCEGGVLLGEIIEFALPRGWFLPVTPGTRFVTLGGAIANDVHGKNHHRDGTLGHHVPRFELLRSGGSRLLCSPAENADYYRATIGGLGLTGLITWAEIRLRKVAGPWIRQKSMRFTSLDQFFELCAAFQPGHQYVVAWLDCTSRGDTRGLFFAGDHDESTEALPSRRKLGLPVQPPFPLVNAATLKIFNELYYRAPRHGGERGARASYETFFYPLDGLAHWNRMYGPKGFFQYQAVVPDDSSGKAALAEMLARIAASGQGSFLAVLKQFGAMPPAGIMSFPRPGYTLALDFANQGARTASLFEALDAIVIAAQGRLYPAKDARMPAAAFQAFYPRWREFSGFIDPGFSSSFWRRVTGEPSMALPS